MLQDYPKTWEGRYRLHLRILFLQSLYILSPIFNKQTNNKQPHFRDEKGTDLPWRRLSPAHMNCQPHRRWLLICTFSILQPDHNCCGSQCHDHTSAPSPNHPRESIVGLLGPCWLVRGQTRRFVRPRFSSSYLDAKQRSHNRLPKTRESGWHKTSALLPGPSQSQGDASPGHWSRLLLPRQHPPREEEEGPSAAGSTLIGATRKADRRGSSGLVGFEIGWVCNLHSLLHEL